MWFQNIFCEGLRVARANLVEGLNAPSTSAWSCLETRSALGILFSFWVMGFLILMNKKDPCFLPRGTGIKERLILHRGTSHS